MASDLTLPAIALAGVISFLSPCVLPLVPPYLSFLAGSSLAEMAEARPGAPLSRGPVLRAAFAFVLGFSLVFIALGAGASLIGAWLRAYSLVLAQVAGVAIILMGLNFLGVFRLTLLMREARFQPGAAPGPLGALLMGMAFAFGWTPCIGPVLAGVLAVAGSEASVMRGAGLLAVYSMGLGVPFLLAALAMGRFMRFLARFKRHLGRVEQAMGLLLVLTGIAFLTGSINAFGFYVLEMFPALGRLG